MLGRLTKRLYLCFDADAAGQEATLRGMELAAGQGFDIHIVSLPPGTDPGEHSHYIRDLLVQSGWRVEESLDEVRLYPPGSTALATPTGRISLVNGVFAVRDGQYTGVRAGKVLRAR